jgi:hypothetical protein
MATKRDPHKLRTTAFVVYGTLVLAWLLVPQGLTNWLKELDPSTPRTVLMRIALDVQQFSARIGLNVPYERGRALFLRWTGKE